MEAKVDKIWNKISDKRHLFYAKVKKAYKEVFNVSNNSEGLLEVSDPASKNILLMIIGSIFPQLRSDCQALTHVPLHIVDTIEKVQKYIEELKKYGESTDNKVKVSVLGHTGIGKTSFCRTIEMFSKDPSMRSKPFLTGDSENRHLLETKVLDVIKEVNLSNIYNLSATSEPIDDKNDAVHLIKVKECQGSQKGRREKVEMSFIDMGGHTEYFLASHLFFTPNSNYAIMFDSNGITKKNYHTRIGTYINLIHQSSSVATIFLVASKIDLASGSSKELRDVLKMAKEHIKFLAKRRSGRKSTKKYFIHDEVLRFSSKTVNKEMLEKVSSVFSTVLSNKDIVQTHRYFIPSTWERMIDVVNKRKEIVVNISKFKGYNELIRKEKEASKALLA